MLWAHLLSARADMGVARPLLGADGGRLACREPGLEHCGASGAAGSTSASTVASAAAAAGWCSSAGWLPLPGWDGSPAGSAGWHSG